MDEIAQLEWIGGSPLAQYEYAQRMMREFTGLHEYLVAEYEEDDDYPFDHFTSCQCGNWIFKMVPDGDAYRCVCDVCGLDRPEKLA